eukprot:10105_1
MSLIEEKEQLYEYVWKIDRDELSQWKQAKPGDMFECKQFGLCGEIWQIAVYPKGNDEEEQYVVIHLECKSLNGNGIVAVDYKLICEPLHYDVENEHSFQVNDTSIDNDTYQSFDELCFNDIDQLTTRFIIRSVVKTCGNKNEFKWTINTETYDKTKTNDYDYSFESSSLETKDGELDFWLCLKWGKFDYDGYIYLVRDEVRDDVRCSYAMEMTDIKHKIQRCFPFVDDSNDKAKFCSLQSVQQLKQWKIKCTMNNSEETEPTSNDGLHWNISDDLLQQFKSAKIGDSFLSPIFKSSDTIWYLLIEPTECKDLIDIKLIRPKTESFNESTKIKYVITCEEMNYVHEETVLVKGAVSSILQISAVWNQLELKQLNTLNIRCKIDIQKEKLETKKTFCYIGNNDRKIKFDEITSLGFEQDDSSDDDFSDKDSSDDKKDNDNSDDDDEKDDNSDNDNALYNKHRNTLKTWNENSAQLEAMYLNGKPLSGDKDDEKKQDDIQSNNFGVMLYEKYSQCSVIIQQQTTRMKQTATNDHLLELISRNNELSKLKKEKESKIKSSMEYNAQMKEYQILKQKRIEFQNQIKIQFMQCNDMIKKENILFKQLIQTEKCKNKLENEVQKISCSSVSCVEMIKSYNKFMEDNKKYIDKIIVEFNKLWDEFESKWMKWSMEDIVIWFKYKT